MAVRSQWLCTNNWLKLIRLAVSPAIICEILRKSVISAEKACLHRFAYTSPNAKCTRLF